jgi:histidine triad (HIT) family protein
VTNDITMETCIFCRILEHRAPARVIYEDEWAVAIEDIHPQAPVHLLVIPRKHVPSLNDAAAEDELLLGHLLRIAAQLARERQLEKKGYRTVINNGSWAGQSVDHLHVHVLGGRAFHWPPG